MTTDPSFEVPDAAWRQAAEGIPWSDTFDHDGGRWRLLLVGIWSTGKRAYEYSSAEVAGYTLGQAAQLGLAKRIVSANPGDVSHYRTAAEAGWDREFLGLTRTTSSRSHLTAWVVAADAPIRLKYATMYRSSGGVPHGSKHSLFAPATVNTAVAYRRTAQEFRRSRHLAPPLPAESIPPTEKQLNVLRRLHPVGLALPTTAAAARPILDALSKAHWQLTPVVRRVWWEATHKPAAGCGVPAPDARPVLPATSVAARPIPDVPLQAPPRPTPVVRRQKRRCQLIT